MKKDGDWRLGRYLFVTYLAVALIPVLLLGVVFYRITSQTIINNAIQSSRVHLQNNVQKLNIYFDTVRERAMALSLDAQLYLLFSSIDLKESLDTEQTRYSDLLEISRKVSTLLSNYFPSSLQLHSAGIITENFVFSSKLLPNYGELKRQSIYDAASRAEGDVVWIPTYDYIELLDQPALRGTNADYQHMLSAVRCLYIHGIYDGYRLLDVGDMPPILLLNIKPETISDMINFDENTAFVIYGTNGEIVSCSQIEIPALLNETPAASGQDGIRTLDGVDYVVSRAKIESVGWNVISAVSLNSLLGRVAYMPRIVQTLMLLLAFTSAILAYRFKKMKARMDAIIKTGYERELYARESEIQALNVQLNPHFLYNTLGSFHFLALESGNAKLSRLIMALCRMLQYTSYQGDEMTTLREDVKRLENYLLIMKERVSDLFKIHLDLDDSLMDMCVPKLFLQPFVENALRYVLDPNKPFVNLRIMGLRQGQYAVFEVRDDGKGMEQAQVNAILSGRGRSVGIVNVQRRLKLIYEGQASLQIISNIGNGMHVIIQIPVN